MTDPHHLWMLIPLPLAPSDKSLFALQRLARQIRYWVESPVPGSPFRQPQLLPKFHVVWRRRSVVHSRLPSLIWLDRTRRAFYGLWLQNFLDALARLTLNTRMWISVSMDPSSAAESPEQVNNSGRVRRLRILMAVIHRATRERIHLGVE